MKLSQEKFGELLGVSRAVINNLEGDSQKPTVDFLISLASEFNVSLDTILLPKPVLSDQKVCDLLAVSPDTWSTEQVQQVISYIRQLEQKVQGQAKDLAASHAKHERVVKELREIQQKVSAITKES